MQAAFDNGCQEPPDFLISVDDMPYTCSYIKQKVGGLFYDVIKFCFGGFFQGYHRMACVRILVNVLRDLALLTAGVYVTIKAWQVVVICYNYILQGWL